MKRLRKNLLVLTMGAFAAVPAADERPNILIILADDLGYGDVGCYNPESKVPTPRLDELAEIARPAGEIEDRAAKSPGFIQIPVHLGLTTDTESNVIVLDHQVGLFRAVHHALLVDQTRFAI